MEPRSAACVDIRGCSRVQPMAVVERMDLPSPQELLSRGTRSYWQRWAHCSFPAPRHAGRDMLTQSTQTAERKTGCDYSPSSLAWSWPSRPHSPVAIRAQVVPLDLAPATLATVAAAPLAAAGATVRVRALRGALAANATATAVSSGVPQPVTSSSTRTHALRPGAPSVRALDT